MTPHPPKHDPEPRRPRSRSRPRHRWSLEQLEDRTLLATVPGADIADAIPLNMPSDVTTGTIAPGAPVFFRIDPDADALLIARVHAPSTLTRLSLLDNQGHLLVQSDGQSSTSLDDLISQHVVAGTDYLELQSLDGAGSYTLTTGLMESSPPYQPAPAGSNNASTIVFGDFTGDGILDFSGPDGVHQGVGDGTFLSPTVLLPISGEDFNPRFMTSGDFTGDGRTDLAVVGDDASRNSSIEVLLRNVDGTFQAQQPIDLGNISVSSFISGDFNGDGRADLVFAGDDNSSGNNIIEVLLSNGHGGFQGAEPFDLGESGVDSLVSGDFTGAGHLDLAATVLDLGSGNFSIEVLGGNGIGTFHAAMSIQLGDFGSKSTSSLVSGDFTGAGHLDLAVAGTDSSGHGRVELLLSDGHGNLHTEAPIDLADFGVSSLVSGDFTGDGRADLAVGGRDSLEHGSVEVLPSNSDGSFHATAPIDLADFGVSSLVSGDFTGDGRADLAVAEKDASGTLNVKVLQGNGNGVPGNSMTGESMPISSFFRNTGHFVSGDFTGDGRLDLAVVEGDASGNASVEVLLDNGDGTFRAAPPIDAGNFTPFDLVSGDFTGDGRLDLAVVAEDASKNASVEVLQGNGDGTFRATTPIALDGFMPLDLVPGDGPVSGVYLLSGDFRGDGHLDLAIAGFDDSWNFSVEVLLGNGEGTLQPQPPIDLGSFYFLTFTSGDFTGNGNDDLAIAGMDASGAGGFDVLLLDGDGTSQPPQSIDLGGFFPAGLVSGDFMGDGRTDLAVAGSDAVGKTSVEVLRVNGQGTIDAPTPIALGDLIPTTLVVGVGDFTGDGRADLAVAGTDASGHARVEVLRVNGQGTIDAPTPIALGDFSPTTLVAGEFTGDGHTDLAVGTNSDSGFIEVLRGNGDGTFGNSTDAEPTSIFNGSFFSAHGPFVSGDFNGDGRLDLAVAESDSIGNASVDVQLGNGDGTFNAPTPIDLGNFTPLDLVSGEFTGDGRIDIAIAGYDAVGHASIEVLLGNGDGTFPRQPPVDLGNFTLVTLTSGDFTGDGRADLAVAEVDLSGHTRIEVLRGNIDGTFQAQPPVDLGNFIVASLGSRDFTGDGRADLAIAESDPSGHGRVEILRGNIDGTFQSQPPIDLGNFIPRDLEYFNNDGHTDLAVGGNDIAGHIIVDVLLGNGDGTFRASTPIDLGAGFFEGILTGDFNADGRADLAVESDYAPSRFEVLLGKGDGTFGPPIVSDLTQLPIPTVAGDFNRDGRTDLAFSTGTSGVQLRLGLGNGQFAAPGEFTGVIHDNPLVADPGDGTNDLFVVDQSGNILWRKAQPQAPGGFAPPITINPGFPARDVAFVPTRQGGLIASVDLRDDAVSLYAYRDGRFLPVTSLAPSVYRPEQFFRVGTLATGALPAQIVAVDLNGDGNVDLVVRNAGDGTVSVYLGDGDGGFVRQADVPIGLVASDIALADLDGSGRVDLVVTNQNTGDVRIRLGNGDGTFAAPSVYPAGAGPYTLGVAADHTTEITSPEATAGVAIGTFTQGGKTDLVTIDPGSNSFAVLVGLGGGAFANPPKPPFFTSTPATVVRSGDFTGTGVTDLAVLGPDGVTIYLGDGKGGFVKTKTKTYDVGPDPTGLTVADVNGDGIPDLIVGNSNGDVLVLLGNGDGTFHTAPPIDQRISLAVASVGANGQDAFAFAAQGLDQVAAQAAGAAKPQTLGDRAHGVRDPGAVTLADLNGDGVPDLIVANGGGNDVLVYPGLSDGTLDVKGVRAFFTGTDPVGITVANVDGDGDGNGRLDLVVANEGSNDISILLNEPTPGGGFTLVPGPRLKAGFGPMATTVANVNGDGIPDILVSDSRSNDVRVLYGVGAGFFNDVNPPIIPIGIAPGPLFVANFTGRPGQLDLVTVNAGSNDLSLILDINGGNRVAQSIPSGGEFPIAAVEGNFDGGVTDLLVANNEDGHLALFLGGPDGLKLSRTFEEPNLPNPTALVMDAFGHIFGTSEGVEAAIAVILGLGGGGNEGGPTVLPTGPSDQQVVLLQPLSQSSLAVVATLLSVAVEMPGGEITETGEAEIAGPGASGAVALPNQAMPTSAPKGDAGADPDGESAQDEVTAQGAPVVAQATPSTVARFFLGLDEAFAKARLKARQGTLFGETAEAQTTERTLKALDALLARWSPIVAAVGGPVPTLAVELGRYGVAITRAVDSALQSLGSETARPLAACPAGPSPSAGPVLTEQSALAIGTVTFGLAVLAWPHADSIRPPLLRRHHSSISTHRP